ncbi:MAG: CRISPR-associated helicase Cas3' [Methylococcales bacterium]|nr:CRISPR-associated helicase Cas3' [Methylococcales bacterium]
MMVTFVSQCQKKALSRTRRVLDSFANRIGDNTWQTVITNEGLNAVKKLLRKTASKNTAVSCFWIRSRSRSELVWIVGNRDEFNTEGIVPVNYTNQKNALKMDGMNVNIENYYANTKKQPLDQHLFAVGYVAYLLCKQLTDNETLAKAVFVAGCWHDVGKIDSGFQNWILDKTKKKLIDEIPEEGQHIDKSGSFSFEKHPRHNEISSLLYYLFDDESDKSVNKANKKLVQHTIYWHHAKPIRKEEFETLEVVYNKLIVSLTEQSINSLSPTLHTLINSINVISENLELDLKVSSLLKQADEDSLSGLRIDLPRYKSYGKGIENIKTYQSDIDNNARNNIARTAVISADRLVSALSADALNTHIEQNTLQKLAEDALLTDRGLISDIKTCLQGFEEKYPNSDRNKQQKIAAQNLVDDIRSVGVLNGPAGCGKTKIALEWAANTNARKIIWICPRVQICQGLVNDLTSDEYLPNTKIEICTGEFKTIYQNGTEQSTPEGQEFSGDIVLTTIDQVINTITTHNKVTGLVQYMNAHVVFDEYHEYIPMDGFNLLFAELVVCKQQHEKKVNTLLVSATPNFYFVNELLAINDIVNIDSFNQSQYKIEFEDFDEKLEDGSNPLYSSQTENTFVISNTAIAAQKSFIKNQNNENAILIHSKFKPQDRKELFDKVFNAFKQDGSKDYDVLRSGPIVQASLNITCNKMITEFTNAENWLQRMGRLDRFGENETPNIYISAITENVKNGKSLGNAKFLNSLYCLQSSKAWFDFLQAKLPEDGIVNISKMYQIYQAFYENETSIKAIEQDLIVALKTSVNIIDEKIIDPISFPKKTKLPKGSVKIKNNSLRGNSRFVQMAVINIDNGVVDVSNEYACMGETFTLSVSEILGYGDSEKNLLDFMAKKHHSIIENKNYGVKATTKYKDRVYLKKAKEPETPIYLSYTPNDLKKVEAEPHSYAIYYAVGKNQSIGAISAHQLKTIDYQ